MGLWMAGTTGCRAACGAFPSSGANLPPAADITAPAEPPHQPLAVVGDPQGRVLGDRLFREDNEAATRGLFGDLRAQQPTAVVVLGDLVSVGASPVQWQRFEQLVSGLHVYPVVGNHDLKGNRADADRLWRQHFPWMRLREPSWYRLTWKRLGLVFLNSNCSDLGEQGCTHQNRFYRQALDDFRGNTVRGVVVFLHHPPQTDNPNVRSEPVGINQAFVEPLAAYPKVLAVIAGHAHGYERYQRIVGGHPVELIVSAGGGGPRPRMGARCYADECYRLRRCQHCYRPMNYLLLRTNDQQLEITVRAWSDEGHASELETVSLGFRGN